VVQPGSLPLYAAIALATVLLLPGVAVVRGFVVPADLRWFESPMQVGVAVVVVFAAVATARVRRRLSAVLLLGAVGYGVAVLFVLQGAPDLALTQLLVETLSLAVFVLVLRRLPEQFGATRWRFGQTLRLAIATGIGVFMAAFAVLAGAARQGPTGAAEYLSRAEPEGGGTNVVNVILTDFRALDTLGEITVLALAAMGAIALVRARLTESPQQEEGEPVIEEEGSSS
jgi:multicomponent Na+:H+ antiporter subunit A